MTSVGPLARALASVFVAAMLQIVIVSAFLVAGGAPDVLLVVVVALGLLRGAPAGAVLGFFGGLVVDVVTLGTLGISSLVLTLAGFWSGRYAETTGRGRSLAPLAAVGVITVLAGLFGFVLHYMLGEDVDARHSLLTALVPALVLNLLLALPVHRVLRAIVGEGEVVETGSDVEVVVS
jgi:rod shape-determining protein MreD